MGELDGKVAIVTGAGVIGGLGAGQAPARWLGRARGSCSPTSSGPRASARARTECGANTIHAGLIGAALMTAR